jgi:RHS repeat-associated protein
MTRVLRASESMTAGITVWRRAVLARVRAQVPTSTSNSAPSTAFGSPHARMAVRWLALLLAMTGALGTPAAAQSTPGAPLTRGRVIIETHHTDLAGNIRLSTNEAGTVVRRLDYAPFGEVESVPCGGTAAPSPQFQGKLRDPKTCLDDFGARDYAAATGRFQTVDPVLPVERALRDPQQWNRYAYARNNPLIYTDPDGRLFDFIWDLTNAAMGISSFIANVTAGNATDAAVDAVGILFDAGSAAVPGWPGGAGTLIKTRRVADRVKDGVQSLDRAADAAKGGEAGTEVVQRWMSQAELHATQSTGLLRGGRGGEHFVTDAANTGAQRARQRLALPQTPDIRVTLEVPGGVFSAPTRVQPKYNMPGGGMERRATGQIPVKIVRVDHP